MKTLVPQWTARFTNEDVIGADHLGVEGMAQSYQQNLVPDIISTTDHARYYSFYCWILHRYNYQPDSARTLAGFRGQYFKRHELAFMLSCHTQGGFGQLSARYANDGPPCRTRKPTMDLPPHSSR